MEATKAFQRLHWPQAYLCLPYVLKASGGRKTVPETYRNGPTVWKDWIEVPNALKKLRRHRRCTKQTVSA